MVITIDFESAYGVHPITKENVTLTKLTTEEYIRHPLFKVHGVGLKVDARPAIYVHGDEAIRKAFARIPWGKAAVLAHHAHFDMAILNWIYGITPGFILDTLSMANALFPWESSSLATVCKRLGVPDKGTELATTKNKWTLTAAEMEVLGNYCIQDVEITRQCFDKMAEGFPLSELKLIDQTVRMFSEPALVADLDVLLNEYRRERKHKRAFLKQADVDKETIMSNDKFALALESLGVVPPTKVSPKTGKTAWAFAKSDEEFKQLLDHEDEQVRWLVEARLTNKTTIKETRTRRMFKTGKRGEIPVYLRYHGAHTSRWCLTGDTEIVVLRSGDICTILLPYLRHDDMVWDGEEFVNHGGLVCRGEQEVITHDGITGTKEHKVFCDGQSHAVPLSVAKNRGYQITTARLPCGKP